MTAVPCLPAVPDQALIWPHADAGMLPPRALNAHSSHLQEVLARHVHVMMHVGPHIGVLPGVTRGVVGPPDAPVRIVGCLQGGGGGGVAILAGSAADPPLDPMDLLACTPIQSDSDRGGAGFKFRHSW